MLLIGTSHTIPQVLESWMCHDFHQQLVGLSGFFRKGFVKNPPAHNNFFGLVSWKTTSGVVNGTSLFKIIAFAPPVSSQRHLML